MAAKEFRYKKDDEILKHTINLFLELFKECEILHEDLSELTVLTDLKHINRLNWELLPKGKMPWEKVEEHLNPILKQLKNTKKPADEARLRHIYSYNPTTVFYGKSGFNGYVGFEFKEFTILESLLYGNICL